MHVALNSSSILVLEDEPAVLGLITASLHAGDYENVLAATSIAEARTLWQKHAGHFDLVLTDFSLPDGSAASFIGDLLRQKQDLPVIVMSGLPEDALGLEPSIARKVRIMSKPFRPSELLVFLRDTLLPIKAA